MYPPRSQKNEGRKKAKKQKIGKAWIITNLVLLLMIAGLFGYYYIFEHGKSSSFAENNGLLQQENKAKTDSAGGGQSSSPIRENVTAVSNEQLDNSSNGDEQAASTDPNESEQGKKAATDGTASPTVMLHFIGDVQFFGKVEQRLEKNGFDFPYQYLGNLFRKDDLTIANLETPVTTGGVGALNKTYVYKSSPKALTALAAAGIDAVNLANNHILDQGTDGLLDTLKYLKEDDIAYTGAGRNAKEAYAPHYFERKGIKIALLGATRVMPEANWNAGVKQPGVAGAYDSTAIVKSIREAREQADLVIVIAHWGKERVTVLEPHQTELSHAFIDAGADLVIGGHPHVLQGMEQYKGKWIAYSTGNFIFSKSTVPATWDTAIFQATCTRTGACSMKLTPYRAELGQPVPLKDAEASKILQGVAAMSPGNVSVGADGIVTAR
ncbi:CapA family protein [Paenibacillus sp. NPDC055715]